ncbi:MAG: hypothetical protein AB7T49_16130 [Oligoflexales bacterium]
MRFLSTTLCLTLAVSACGKKKEDKETVKSAEDVAAEQGIDIAANDYLVMKIDDQGNTTLVKTDKELTGTDMQSLAAEEASLFNGNSAAVVSIVNDESALDSSTESSHFDNDDIDCFKVKIKVKIQDDDGDTIRKMKDKLRVCENFGPMYGLGANRVLYRPLNYFYNRVDNCRYVRFRPNALRFWNGSRFRDFRFNNNRRFDCDGRDFCDRDLRFGDCNGRDICDNDCNGRNFCDNDCDDGRNFCR